MVPSIEVVVSVVQSSFEAVEVKYAAGGEVMVVVIAALEVGEEPVPVVPIEASVADEVERKA